VQAVLEAAKELGASAGTRPSFRWAARSWIACLQGQDLRLPRSRRKYLGAQEPEMAEDLGGGLAGAGR